MLNLDIGHIAISLTGHDKGSTYLIVAISDGFVYLADGKSRKLSDAKKKNPKHIQIVYVEDEKRLPIKEAIVRANMRDEEVKYFLKTFGGKNV